MAYSSYKGKSGSLSMQSARIGLKVVCVKSPNVSDRVPVASLQALNLPIVGRTYHISAIAVHGVTIRELHNPKFSHPIFSGDLHFPFDSFDPASTY